MKKKHRKRSSRKVVHNKSSAQNYSLSAMKAYSRYIVIAFVFVIGVLITGISTKAFQKTRVLGTTTGPVLVADHGGDMGQGTNGPGPQGISTSNQSGGNGPSTATQNGGTNTFVPKPPNPSGTMPSQFGGVPPISPAITQVDCIGPDGKHFTTDFHTCQELSQKWGRPNFLFTPLGNQPPQNETNQQLHSSQSTGSALQPPHPWTVQTQGSKGKINLNTPGTQIQINSERNGQVNIEAQQGTDELVQLESNALNAINDALREKNITVGSSSADGLVVTSGNVQADTSFPLSIDSTTKTLTVSTPDGKKALSVLPDQAVRTLLQTKIFDSVEMQANAAAGSTSAVEKVHVTLLNNEPVFQAQGITNKKVFGFIPVAFEKTAFVSAQTGQVVKIDEPIVNKILETFSF